MGEVKVLVRLLLTYLPISVKLKRGRYSRIRLLLMRVLEGRSCDLEGWMEPVLSPVLGTGPVQSSTEGRTQIWTYNYERESCRVSFELQPESD